ncbi:MAG: RAMP superfamily CRISPR-associated protein [Oscillospiraceae bacterium]|nr:RAMP superfamily CRISPR-associated protein [Oscillospiraceae bacterium]
METSYSGKPYFFVPMVSRADRRRALNRQNLLAADTFVGKLNVKIECMTPLHFGSGQLMFDESAKRFAQALLREDGHISLSGSSFKGMLRAVFEAVSESCVLNAPRALPIKVEGLSPCTSNSGLCPACSVFGRLSHKGKLTLSSFYTDAKPTIMSLPRLEQPFRTYPRPRGGERNPFTGNERLYYGKFRDVRGIAVAKMSKVDFFEKKKQEPRSGGSFYGRKFYKHSNNWDELSRQSGKGLYECLQKGTVLTGKIAYQGLMKDELGALLFALGLGWDKPIFHKLGYAKPAYLGSVQLTVESELLPRYEDAPIDAKKIAARYYDENKSSIEAAVCALAQEWSEIGDSKWVMQDGKYGY